MRRHLVKFHADRLSSGGDITVFRFFQDGGSPLSWIFKS